MKSPKKTITAARVELGTLLVWLLEARKAAAPTPAPAKRRAMRREGPVFAPITCTAKGSVTVGLALDMTGEALLDLSLEAESGSDWRNIEIVYIPMPNAEVRKLSLPATVAAHIPELLAALNARSRVLDPIEAIV